jgi:hypothetical protein
MLEQFMFMEAKMKITEKEFNAITGKETITERDETTAETKIRETLEKEIAKAIIEAETKAAAKKAILDRLGLTADEAKLILG